MYYFIGFFISFALFTASVIRYYRPRINGNNTSQIVGHQNKLWILTCEGRVMIVSDITEMDARYTAMAWSNDVSWIDEGSCRILRPQVERRVICALSDLSQV